MNPQIESVVAKYGLTVESVFVPFSQSRNANAGEKFPSLNWRVTLKQHGRTILTTDYSAGCAHAPSYNQRMDYDTRQLVNKECESGYACKQMYTMGHIQSMKNKPILPDSYDVIYSLLLDSEVLYHDSFESWAGEFGYDEDSRHAESLYNECIKIALKFRQIGESTIAELRDAYQDY